MGKLKFGWAEVDITPKTKISLDGEFFERVTDEVETPITVTALAIYNEVEQVVFCSCDLIWITESLLEGIRLKIKNKDIDVNKIIISGIHTHNSYTYAPNQPDKESSGNSLDVIKKLMPKNCKYNAQVTSDEAMELNVAFDFLSEKIAEAVESAWNNLAEGGYKPAFGRVAVGMNRRVCYSDNTAKMWGDADKSTFISLEGGNDNGMELLFIYNSNNEMTGVVANIACPSQVMEQRSVISSDFWGKVKILLREKYGKDFKVLGLGGAGGDQCPRDLIRWVEPETPIKDPNVIRVNPKHRRADPSMFDVKGTWKIGKRIVSELELIIDEIKDDEIITEAELKHKTQTLNLPLRKVSESDRIEAEKTIKEFFKDKTEIDYIDTAELHVYAGTILRYEYQNTHNLVPVEVHTVRLGDVAFVTNPFELFLDYGNEIKARSEAAQTFVLQLSNGAKGYLPTKQAEEHGHYSAYVSSGIVGHVGGSLLVGEALESIKELFNY